MRLVNEQSMETLPESGVVWFSWKGIAREQPMTVYAIRKLPTWRTEDSRRLMAWSYTATTEPQQTETGE